VLGVTSEGLPSKSEIFFAFSTGQGAPALGSIWRVTAKKTDFYLDMFGPTGETMHISLHGPRGGKKTSSHRFHLRIDEDESDQARAGGYFVEHAIPEGGKSSVESVSGRRRFR